MGDAAASGAPEPSFAEAEATRIACMAAAGCDVGERHPSPERIFAVRLCATLLRGGRRAVAPRRSQQNSVLVFTHG